MKHDTSIRGAFIPLLSTVFFTVLSCSMSWNDPDAESDGVDDPDVLTEDMVTDDGVTDEGCASGLTDCGGTCVDTTSNHSHCGACSRECLAVEVCNEGECVHECPPGKVLCEGACVDVMTDLFNCGSCGKVCIAGTRAQPLCESGVCSVVCHEGWSDLDGDGSCETNCVPSSDVESCNGVDDNCDGRIDESFECALGHVVGCTTDCGSTGTGTCGGDCRIPPPERCDEPDELCNALDDDCDGAADNGFECVRGETRGCISSCGTPGSQTCVPSCVWSVCDPPDEVCNGLDDDCDGTCDDGFECCRDDVIECMASCGTTGTQTCGPDCGWNACDPPDELCNGADDDCDTLIDEDFECAPEDTASCETSCGSIGTKTCGDGCSWGECAAPDEDCANGVDDDCDTVIDWDMVTPPVRVSDDDSNALYSAVAWSGSEYGVAWLDGREGGRAIYFNRVTPGGIVGGEDVYVSDSTDMSFFPSLAWSGSEYGVAWNDDRDGNDQIYFSRLSPTGVKMGSELQVTTVPELSKYQNMVWSGSEYGLAWQDDREESPEIFFARISAAGTKLGTDVRITDTATDSWYPSLAWTETEYGIAWLDDNEGVRRVYFSRISASGTKLGGDNLIADASQHTYYPCLAWSGSEFGLAWNDYRSESHGVYFTRISSAGAKLGGDIFIGAGSAYSYFPSLEWGGGEYGYAWGYGADFTDIHFTRLSPTGTKLDEDMVVASRDFMTFFPMLAWNDEGFGVTWSDSSDMNWETFFAFIACD